MFPMHQAAITEAITTDIIGIMMNIITHPNIMAHRLPQFIGAAAGSLLGNGVAGSR